MHFKIAKSKTGSVVHIAEVIITAADAAHESIFNIVQRCTARSKLFYVVFPEYSPSEVYAEYSSARFLLKCPMLPNCTQFCLKYKAEYEVISYCSTILTITSVLPIKV
ncbi:leukemia-associated protein 2 [Trichinella spiralis]|uniref:leukemia-associated protein 2 n=1 Tax=Trichinella spiralis TaxID=6334 RepID=UPI0001EFB5EF|nr:leukemia-associated protein 2 [Trichinella spiralis]